MKIFPGSLLTISALLFLAGCNGKSPVKKEALAPISDSITVADTGFTGIKQYKSGKYLIKEITFKNGVREGLMKQFYATGEVRQTFWLRNGLRQDSSIWYFQEGQKFRVTPYINDTIEGIQKQYFRTGELKAKLGYSKGLRTSFFQEFTKEGKLISGYPSIVTTITDTYKTKGIYRITVSLSNKSPNVRYYQGEFSKGLFDTVHCERIKSINGITNLDLKKSNSKKLTSVNIIAEILTDFGNNYLAYKKIELPYKDLK